MSGERAPLLDVDGLSVGFPGAHGDVPAVTDVAFSVAAGETLGIVGESGSGKTVSALAVMGLVDAPARVAARRLVVAGRDVSALAADDRVRRAWLAQHVAMIFQDPLASLDPCYSVGDQLDEVLRQAGTDAERASKPRRRERVLELLRAVEIPDPAARLAAYPHQLSGGMAQRVMIAQALAARPALLIADEPTTALDVTVQAQVLALLRKLQADTGMALLMISHDLAVIAAMAARVVVMYAGEVVETGAVPAIFAAPRHPYTAALTAALPEAVPLGAPLAALPGRVPDPRHRPAGCVFAPRCARREPACTLARPSLTGDGNGTSVRCCFPLHGRASPLPAAASASVPG